MNLKIQKISILLFLFSGLSVFSQIKEEQLILDKKREPEVKKIEKKKTSVESIKNYPPEEKSQNPVEYSITNVPALSDFQTSTLQADDISPNLKTDYYSNYVRFGMGNYGKILGDANVSYTLENKLEVGADAHINANHGLQNIYAWDSRQTSLKAGAFLNGYGEKGKYNVTADFGQENYNYYGIYALNPASDVDINQKVNAFRVKGSYDHFSNEYLNNITFKSSFLSDRFGAKENKGALDFNFSKHDLELPLNDVKMNADLGLGLETQSTDFEILNTNSSSYFLGNLSPKVTFIKDKSYLTIGSGFTYLSTNESNLSLDRKANKTYWFPKAELQLAKSDELKFYAGVDGGLSLNSYASMLEKNLYIVSDQRVTPTETKYNVYLGIRGDVDELIKYDVSIGHSKVNDILFYQTNNLFDTSIAAIRNAYDFANTFSAIYDNGTKNEVNASLQYFPRENFNVSGSFHYINYKMENFDNIYNVPTFSAELGAEYTLLNKKLLLGFKGFMASTMVTNLYDVTNTGLSTNYTTTEQLNTKFGGYVDFNLSAEYKIHKNFSIFAIGNNLIGGNYSTLQGYQVLGAQILGGLKVSF
ncbi:TonB-dependent receptor [Frigoriflavimonas asaccharolytica]|uniref:TonB-dependent receptor n=1 Tax=Frigoriflavimonas asaccharolytica TaxID=2735899 RepID=A0A8J8K4Q7_9FLAO|nr:TonB-dependent receptor [Frigoriflavimonas asaccharolytica]NRS91995.1 hypothetical protein [Frigoriflavimonas asaccharolytica]